MGKISPRHPRAESLRIRERLAEGFKRGLVTPEGLAAHGRGEAFDYFLGERSTPEAKRAIRAAVASLLLARTPVISVNGNVAALVPKEVVELTRLVGAKIEVNLFHGSKRRERRIASWIERHGGKEILGITPRFWAKIPEIHSDRRKVDTRGIWSADLVLVPLEDGDRTEALKKLGKRVVAIDLNPMSRTARAADITVVDNIVRALPLMIEFAERLSRARQVELRRIVQNFDNKKNLAAVFERMRGRLP
jgi:4-phosphopantoate--beta-alanine ligase